MTDKKLYCCYSLRLRDYLTANGIRYEICALNPNNHHRFWVYIKNDNLNKILLRWSK